MREDFLSGADKARIYDEAKRYVQRDRTKVGAILYSLNKVHGMVNLVGRGNSILLRTPSGIFEENQIWEEYNLRKRDFIRMQKRGLIEFKETDFGVEVTMTSRGYVKSLTDVIPTRGNDLPDGYICMVTYDVPEFQKNVRTAFRRALVFVGFKMMQRSVWVHEMDMTKEIGELVEEMCILDYVNICIAKV